MERKKTKWKQRQNLFQTDAWKRFRKNKLALAGTIVILLLILAAVLAPLLAQNDPYVSLKDAAGSVMTDLSPSEAARFLVRIIWGVTSSAVWFMPPGYL